MRLKNHFHLYQAHHPFRNGYWHGCPDLRSINTIRFTVGIFLAWSVVRIFWFNKRKPRKSEPNQKNRASSDSRSGQPRFLVGTKQIHLKIKFQSNNFYSDCSPTETQMKHMTPAILTNYTTECFWSFFRYWLIRRSTVIV